MPNMLRLFCSFIFLESNSKFPLNIKAFWGLTSFIPSLLTYLGLLIYSCRRN